MDSCYKIPIVRFLVPYLCGIILCNYVSIGFKFALLATVLLSLVLLTAFHVLRWQYSLISIICLTTGLFSYKPISSQIKNDTNVPTKNLHGEIIICSLKKQNRKQLNFVTKINDSKYMVYLKKQDHDYLPGDTLTVKKFNINSLSFVDNEHSGYTKYLLSKGIQGQIFLKQKDIVDVKKGHGLFRFVYGIRQNLIHQIQAENVFSPSEEGVFYSLLLGERSYLDDDVKENFKQSGIIHVLAISGLHVGILFVFIQGILKLLRIHNKHFKLLFVVSLLLFYAIIAGLSPSVVRAGLMCCLIQIGFFLQEKNVIMNIVLSSALFLLLFKPQWIWDLGFLLSYFAVIFIVLILENYKEATNNIRNPMLKKVAQLSLVNVAAFTGTFPILTCNFGVVYFGSIISSFFVIPLVTVLVVLGISTLLFSSVKPLFHFLLTLNKYLIQFLNFSALKLSEWISLPFLLEITVFQAVLSYMLLFLALKKNIKWQKKITIISLMLFCMLLSSFL